MVHKEQLKLWYCRLGLQNKKSISPSTNSSRLTTRTGGVVSDEVDQSASITSHQANQAYLLNSPWAIYNREEMHYKIASLNCNQLG